MQKHLVQVGDARPASGDVPSAGPIYRHVSAANGYKPLEVTTLFELFERSSQKFPTNPCLGKREKKADGTVGPYVFKTYAEVAKDVERLASGLRHINVSAKQKVGILGPNSPEWMTAMQACNRQNFVCVPLYDSLGENAIEFIINHGEVVVAFVATEKFPNLVKAIDKVKGTLKSVVYWGAGDDGAIKAIKDHGISVYSFDELIKLGEANPVSPVAPSPEDLCTIMYTSGTTGDPKGVMLNHSAVLAGVGCCARYCEHYNISLKDGQGDRLLSYLPLAHIFDRVNEEWFLMIGGAIGYWQGDVLKLVEDIQELKPTLFIGVPRVFDRIYSRIIGQVETGSAVKKALFNWGRKRKMYFIKQGLKQDQAAPFFDKLVFSKVAARFGGRLKAVVSGGAPLAPHVEEFLRVAMCCPVVQGYGLTETSAASFIAAADEVSHTATVGPPTPLTEFRLESVPEMNYDALDAKEPKGEVLIRGPALFSGYYKQQDKTDEVLEKDGWFHSGDIGVITPDGALKIIDRKKNIFKLSQGEYIAVEKLEAVYKKNPIVEQVWVYGNSFKSSVIAVVVPVKDTILAWAKSNGVEGDFAAVVANPKTKQYILTELVATGKAGALKGFELIKGVILDSNMFTIEEDLLTPTFKLKRPQLQKKYQAQIDAAYSAIKE